MSLPLPPSGAFGAIWLWDKTKQAPFGVPDRDLIKPGSWRVLRVVLSALLKFLGGAVLGVPARPLGYIVGWGTLLLLGLSSALPVDSSLGAPLAKDRHLLVFQMRRSLRGGQK